MKKNNIYFKASMLLALFFLLTLIPMMIFLGNFNKFEITELALVLWLLGLLFSSVMMIFFWLKKASEQDKTRISEVPRTKNRFYVLAPIFMRLTSLICFFHVLLFFVLSIASACLVLNSIDVNEKVFITLFLFVLSIICVSGLISLIFLVVCNTKNYMESETNEANFRDFYDYYEDISHKLTSNGYRLHKVEKKMQSIDIYIFKKNSFSIKYCFLVKVINDEPTIALNEIMCFRNAFLRRCFFDSQIITVICNQDSIENFEENYGRLNIQPRQSTNLNIGVSFSDKKLYFPYINSNPRFQKLLTMKRHFKEICGLTVPTSKNMLVAWLIGDGWK